MTAFLVQEIKCWECKGTANHIPGTNSTNAEGYFVSLFQCPTCKRVQAHQGEYETEPIHTPINVSKTIHSKPHIHIWKRKSKPKVCRICGKQAPIKSK